MNIGLAGWAINRRFKATDNPLKMVDFPKVAKEEFGLDRATERERFRFYQEYYGVKTED